MIQENLADESNFFKFSEVVHYTEICKKSGLKTGGYNAIF